LSSSSLSNLVSPPIEENKPPVDPFFRGFDFCDSILYEGKPLLGPGDLLSEARELLKEKRLPSPIRLKAGLRLGRHAQTSPMLTSTIGQVSSGRDRNSEKDNETDKGDDSDEGSQSEHAGKNESLA
jgi:hypothetical protein